MPPDLHAVQTLRRLPDAGRTGVEQGTRELVIPKSPYVVIYRFLRSDGVQILRIWHGAQQRGGNLTDPRH